MAIRIVGAFLIIRGENALDPTEYIPVSTIERLLVDLAQPEAKGYRITLNFVRNERELEKVYKTKEDAEKVVEALLQQIKSL